MKDSIARAISTVGIWSAVAVVLATGVFRREWTGDTALMVLMVVVLAVCGCAAGATIAIWRGGQTQGPSGGS